MLISSQYYWENKVILCENTNNVMGVKRISQKRTKLRFLNEDNSENLNTRPLVRKQVDFLVDKLIFQQLAQMGNWEIVVLYFAKN